MNPVYLAIRSVRVLKLDRHNKSLRLLWIAIKAQGSALVVSFGITLLLWVIFTALLYLCEHDDPACPPPPPPPPPPRRRPAPSRGGKQQGR